MNRVILTGKIKRIFEGKSNVTFVTVHCKDGKNSEFIDVVIFQNKFFNRYFTTDQWITIEGRVHKNPKNDYKQEIICENIYFAGDNDTWKQLDPDTTDSLPEWDIDKNTGEINTPLTTPTPQMG